MTTVRSIIEALLVIGAVCGVGLAAFLIGAALTGAVSVLTHRRDDGYNWIGEVAPAEPHRSPFAPRASRSRL